jgi:hypothetical protein
MLPSCLQENSVSKSFLRAKPSRLCCRTVRRWRQLHRIAGLWLLAEGSVESYGEIVTPAADGNGGFLSTTAGWADIMCASESPFCIAHALQSPTLVTTCEVRV